jgi:dephospho-CoA kinase
MDAVAVVTASPFAQRRRVMRRPGMTGARYRGLKRAQMPDRAKRARADYLIDTGQPKWATYAAIRRLISCLRARQVR